MYGKVFKKEDENAGGIQKTTVIASFGGLLMRSRQTRRTSRRSTSTTACTC